MTNEEPPQSMRDLFPQFYTPTADEFESLWQNACIAFDANALLNVYSFQSDTLETFWKILDHFSDRVWLPWQAAYEYQKNRQSRIDAQLRGSEGSDLPGKLSELVNKTAKAHHALIDYKQINLCLRNAQSELKSLSDDAIANYRKRCDDYSTKVDDLFTGKIGTRPKEKELKQLREDAERRCKELIPPGFKDWQPKSKEIEGEKQRHEGIILPDPLGDVMIWFELLAHAKALPDSKKMLIFVTDDQKVDWWWQRSGKTIGPRPELRAEMNEVAQTTFYMYDTASFIQYGSNAIPDKVPPEEIKKAVSEAEDLKFWRNDSTAFWTAQLTKYASGLRGWSSLKESLQNRDFKTIPQMRDDVTALVQRLAHAKGLPADNPTDQYIEVLESMGALSTPVTTISKVFFRLVDIVEESGVRPEDAPTTMLNLMSAYGESVRGLEAALRSRDS